MHRFLQRFLDGQCDVEMRRQLANARVLEAERALAAHDEDGALRALGAALGLDPHNRRAEALMMDVLLDSSRPLSDEAEADIARGARDAAVRAAVSSSRWYVLLVPAFVMIGLMGIRDPVLFGLLCGGATLAAVFAIVLRRMATLPPWFTRVAIVPIFATFACVGTIFGPFLIAPILAATTAASMTLSMRADARTRYALALASPASIGTPSLFQRFGFVPRTQFWVHGELHIRPWMVDLDPNVAPVLLSYGTFAAMFLASVQAVRNVGDLNDAERRRARLVDRLQRILPATVGRATRV
jgi:serine/threonine-protein kinase